MKILGNKLFRVFFFTFLLGGIFLFRVPNSKAVGDAYFPNDTTLQITVGSTLTNYTIGGGSNADSLVVNPSSFVITISAGQRLVVYSSDRHIFTNDSGYSTTCPSSDSSSLDVTVVATQKVVTVTPSGTTCTTASTGGSSGGGGGTSSGGGGGGGASTVTATQAPLPSPTSSLTPTSLPTPSIAQTPLAPSIVPSKFSRDLYFGMSGDDVKMLQDYLRTLGYYTNSNSSGFFDTTTKKAVIAWQKKNKLLANGYFGPYSRAQYNKNQTPLTQEATQKNILSLKPGFNLLNIRVSPSTRSKIVGKLKAGQQVNFIDVQNGWYKIQNIDGSFGWVSGQYITIK